MKVVDLGNFPSTFQVWILRSAFFRSFCRTVRDVRQRGEAFCWLQFLNNISEPSTRAAIVMIRNDTRIQGDSQKYDFRPNSNTVIQYHARLAIQQ